MTDTRTIRNRTRGGRVRLSGDVAEAPRRFRSTAGASGSPTRDMDVATGLLASRPDRSSWSPTSIRTPTRWAAPWRWGMGLARRGTPVAVSFAEPDAIPESLRHLPGTALVVDPDELSAESRPVGQPGRRLPRAARVAGPAAGHLPAESGDRSPRRPTPGSASST